VVEAELLVDAALAGHAHHHLGPGAGRAGHFHLSLLNMFEVSSRQYRQITKPKKLKK
jgi:hypothetical protein